MAEQSATIRPERRGRPKKYAAESRSCQLSQRYTLAERAAIAEQAAIMGRPVADYIRERTLNGRARPRQYGRGLDPAAITALDILGTKIRRLEDQLKTVANDIAAQGNVINQLARRSNAGATDQALLRELSKYEHLPTLVQTTHTETHETLHSVNTALESFLAAAVSDDQ